jgi:trehalose 2-sulfotransferase
MSAHSTAYLVLASQRSGSTLLVESLRATGVAGEPGEFFQYLPTTSQSPQPRQWFESVEDESILRLLDPLDEGKPDLRRQRSGVTTSAPWVGHRTASGAAS